MIEKNEIIIKFKNGQSKSSIARDLGISRNTVRSYIKEYESLMEKLSRETDATMVAIIQNSICSKPLRKKAIKPATAFTKEVEQRFNELIKIDEERNLTLGNNKQQLTTALLHRTLVNEYLEKSLVKVFLIKLTWL